MFLHSPIHAILIYLFDPFYVYALYGCSAVLTLVIVCLLALKLYRREQEQQSSGGPAPLTAPLNSSVAPAPLTALIVIGSGGHTTEMLRLVGRLSSVYRRRVYCLADTDSISHAKLLETEAQRKRDMPDGGGGSFEVIRLPRAREVQQPYVTSVLTTLAAIYAAVPVVYRSGADVVLCNGPGTCIPLCGVAFLLDVFFVKRCRIVFVESLCRVKSLSLSGELLYQLRIADKVLVQWPQLTAVYDRAQYIGRLL